MKIYQFNRITGYWKIVQNVAEYSVMHYLELFRKDEPKEFFIAVQDTGRKPTWNPNSIICKNCNHSKIKHTSGHFCSSWMDHPESNFEPKLTEDGYSYKR